MISVARLSEISPVWGNKFREGLIFETFLNFGDFVTIRLLLQKIRTHYITYIDTKYFDIQKVGLHDTPDSKADLYLQLN
jgi:hypothetical protein